MELPALPGGMASRPPGIVWFDKAVDPPTSENTCAIQPSAAAVLPLGVFRLSIAPSHRLVGPPSEVPKYAAADRIGRFIRLWTALFELLLP